MTGVVVDSSGVVVCSNGKIRPSVLLVVTSGEVKDPLRELSGVVEGGLFGHSQA